MTILTIYLNKFKELFNSDIGIRKYFFNTSWLMIEQIIRMILALTIGVYTARYLGPEKYGILNYSLAFVLLFSNVSKLGLDSIVIKELVKNKQDKLLLLGTSFWMKFNSSIITSILIFTTLFFISKDYNDSIYIIIISFTLIFQSFDVIDFFFQSQVLSKYSSISRISQLVISSLLKLIFILLNLDLIYFIIVVLLDQIFISIFYCFFYFKNHYQNFFLKYNFNKVKELLKDSWPLILSGLASTLYIRIDQIMIKNMLNDKEVGFYSVAVFITESLYFIPGILCNSLYPSIVNGKLINEDTYFSRLQYLSYLFSGLALAIIIPLIFLSNNLIVFLYGNAYIESTQILQVYIFNTFFVYIYHIQNMFWITNNLQKHIMILTIISSILNIFLNYIGIILFGTIGSAYATLITYIFVVFIYPLFITDAEKMIRISYRSLNLISIMLTIKNIISNKNKF